MNFDEQFYRTHILNAAFLFLKQNGQRFGQAFMEGFMYDHDTTKGQESIVNAQRFFDFVSFHANRLNGNNQIANNQQLFDIAAAYINEIYNTYISRQQQQRPGMGFGGGPQMGFQGQNGPSMFGRPAGSGFGQAQPVGPGSHLSAATPMAPVAPMPAPTPVAPAASAQPLSLTTYVANPFDAVTDNSLDFTVIPNRTPVWGDDKPKDNRIILAHKQELKTRDVRFSINQFDAFHQQILDDPVHVIKDFLEIVPDSTLSNMFLARVYYNHLDIIDVPTQTFNALRDRCLQAIKEDRQTLLHKTVSNVLDTLPRGEWKAITTYLVKHVNRALYLNARLADKPTEFLRAPTFEDLDELFSSTFKHSFTEYPEGRRKLENIVGSAIWTALVAQADSMFKDSLQLPTHAIQSSPAFPYSIPHVYPNKFAIPMANESSSGDFVQKLQDYELTRRTYVLTRRSVVFTNILGKDLLQPMAAAPKSLLSPVAQELNRYVIPHATNDFDLKTPEIRPFVNENYPVDQLGEYYDNMTDFNNQEVEAYQRYARPNIPVDQTMVALQYGVSASDYLMPFDVFGTIDPPKSNTVILAKRTLPILKLTS